MAKKFEIIGQSLVITDESIPKILFDAPKGEVYYDNKLLTEEGIIKINYLDSRDNTLNTAPRILLSDAVDTTNTPFTEETFLTFARENLGFKVGGGNGNGVTSWGDIVGNIPSQSDLQTVLNSKQELISGDLEESYGSIGFEGNTTETTIPSVNTYTKITGITSTASTKNFSATNGRLTYTKAGSSQVYIHSDVSIDAGNNQILDFKIHINGSEVGFASRLKINSNTDVGFLSVSFNTELNTGDYVEVFVKNETSMSNVTVEEFYLSVITIAPSLDSGDFPLRSEILDEGNNLYNKNDSSNNNSGWLNSLNQVQAHATATHTKYFKIEPSKDYWYLNAYGASTNLIITDDNFNISRAIAGTVDGTFTTASSGESYVRFSVRDMDDFMFSEGGSIGTYEPYLFRVKPNVIDDNIFKDKGVVFFGDSITWFPTGYVYEFNNLVKPLYTDNMGVSGQRITWNNNTVEGLTPPNDSGDNNVLWNSIKGWEATNVKGDPSIIVLAIGTNDISQGSILGSYVDAFSQDEASTTHLTMAGAFRKILTYLKLNYPNTQIFYSTPLQSKTGGRNYDNILNVGTINADICKRLNVKVIDSTHLTGITDEFENASAVGRYLYDGTHPTYIGNTTSTLVGAELGSVLLAKLIQKELLNNYITF